jgi:hypothetical protein
LVVVFQEILLLEQFLMEDLEHHHQMMVVVIEIVWVKLKRVQEKVIENHNYELLVSK